MSVTNFAFLPPNSAGATINIFSLHCMLNTSSVWCLPLQHLPLVLTYQKEGRRDMELPGSVPGITDLSLWLPLVKCMRKKSRSYALCSSSDSWLWALAVYKLLYSSWAGDGAHSPWGMTLLCARLCWLENKSHLHISFQICLCIFYLASLGRESQGFGQQQF